MQILRQQMPPRRDGRLFQRVHKSVCLYVARISCYDGECFWLFDEDIERVVYLADDGMEKVDYKNRRYVLQPASEMTRIIDLHLAGGGTVYLLGKTLGPEYEDNSFQGYPFIDVTLPQFAEVRAEYERTV